MNWFLAKVVYRIISGEGNHQAQFDEQLRLVQAATKQQAYHKAHQIGVAEQTTFTNEKQQLVQWKFINVSAIYLLNKLADGAELYSSIEEKDDGCRYEHVVHAKAFHLLNEVNASPLQQI